MKMLLKRGNGKLSKKILNWSITPIKSCLNCKDCMTKCYAIQSYKQYPCVKSSWDNNFELAKSGAFEEMIIGQLKTTKATAVRIHVSGDFFSQEYITAWERIATQFPEIKFYSYSKVFNLLNLTGLTSLPNVNIINSIAADGKPNFGDAERIDLLKKEGYRLCPATKKKLGEIKCGEDCSLCLTHDKVCFNIH